MISRLEGEIIAAHNGRIELRCGAVVYELLVPACDVQRLAAMVGETVEFHTLHYLEGQGQGASYVPRLIGFASVEDRAFFELFTTVKGLGNRKALRALELPFPDIAAAVAGRDTDLLVSLPEIGKRTAESIVVELSGKMERFMTGAPGISMADGGPPGGEIAAGLLRDAVGVLVQLGEPKLTARHLVERALAADPTLDSPDQVVAAAFRLKELV